MKTTHLLQAFYLVLHLSSLVEAQPIVKEYVDWNFLYDSDYIWFQGLDMENTIEDCLEEGFASSLEKTSKLCKTSPEEFVEEGKEEAEAGRLDSRWSEEYQLQMQKLLATAAGSDKPKGSNTLDACSLPIDEGACEVKMLPVFRWFHCEPFWFQGCGGNKNNFENVSDCMSACSSSSSWIR